MFWCFSYWNPNRITSKLLSFILKVWGNCGPRETRTACAFICFRWGLGWGFCQRVYVALWMCVCMSVCSWVCGSHTFLTLSNNFDLAPRSEMASKWLAATFPPRLVVPHSLSSTSKPTHPSTYNQKEIKWFIISSRVLHKVKTWKIKDKKGLLKTLVQCVLCSSPFFLSF